MAKNLTAKTAQGMKWTFISTIANILMQVGYVAIMARLLPKEAFGVIAFALVLLRLGSFFSQMGLNQALIQKKDLQKEEIRAAFTSNLLLGSVFVMFFLFLAPFATYFLSNPVVVPVLRVMALAVFFEGLASTSLSLIRREMKFKILAFRNMFSYFFSYLIIGVLLAYLNWGIWALVSASVLQTILNGMLAYWMVKHSVLPIFEWKYYKALMNYGSKMSLLSILDFLGHWVDTLIIAKLLGDAALGLYNRAAHLINLPLFHLTKSMSQVLFPSMSKIQSDTDRLRKAYLTTIKLLTFILLPITVGVYFSAQSMVEVVLGSEWLDAASITQILAISAIFRFTTHFGGIVCDATASLTIKLYTRILYLGLMCVMFYVLSPWKLEGFATAILVAEVAMFVMFLFVLKKILQYKWIELLHTYQYGLVSGILVGLSTFGVVKMCNYGQFNAFLTFAGAVFAGGVSLLVALFLPLNKVILTEIKDKVKKTSQKKKTKTDENEQEAMSESLSI